MKNVFAALCCLTPLLLVAACTRPATGVSVASPAAPKKMPSQPSTQSSRQPGSRIYLDPKTGEMRAPTAAEEAAESAAASSLQSSGVAALKATPGVTVTPLPNGMTEYDLGDAGRVRELVCLQKDGSIGACAAKPKQP